MALLGHIGRLSACLLAGLLSLPASADQSGKFDFYVLALSWSPTYCLNEGRGRNDRTQCGGDKAHGFIVHGLWPQFDNGYPEYCPTRLSDRVPDTLGRSLLATERELRVATLGAALLASSSRRRSCAPRASCQRARAASTTASADGWCGRSAT